MQISHHMMISPSMYGKNHVLVAKNSKGVSDEFTPDILFAVVAGSLRRKARKQGF